MFRSLILILLLLGFCPISSSAQEEGNRTITMQLLDSLTQKPVAYAAILCYAEGEKEPSRYGVSDDKGHVEINRLLKGNYLVSIEHLTYVTALKFLSTQKKRKIDLGKVFLVERLVSMDEVVIRGDGPVVQKGDTTEYNARFFNPGPNQYLGELIKKMPGLEVIGNEVFFKGQKVQSLTVEGRPFFISDKGVALENLPAYTVKKVQVFKEKRRKYSGLEERANAPLSMNIVLNDHTKQGLIGNVSPGYGTDSRYLVKGMLGRFGKKATTALIVSCNNLSKDAGSGTNYSFGANGMPKPQMSAGSVGQEGDVRNLMGGIDYARGNYTDGLLYLNGIWTNTDRFVQSITKRETSLTDGILDYRSDDISDSRNNGGGLNFRKNTFVDRSDKGKSTLNISTHLSLNGNQSKDRRENQFSSLRNGLEETGSKGNSNYRGENENIMATGGFSLENYSKRRGFRFSSLRLDFSWSRFESDYRNISQTISGLQSPVIRDMKKEHDSDNLNLGAGLNFGLPGDLSLSYRVRFQKQTSDIKAWDADSLSVSSGALSEASSSKTQNTQVTQDLEFSKTFTFNTKHGKKTSNYRYLTLSMTLRPLWKKTTDKDFFDIYRKWDLIPLVRYWDSRGHVQVKYTGDITHPTIQQLQPVLNDDNPLYILLGNPSLHPSYTHRFTLYKTFRYFSVGADCSSTRNKITRKQETDPYGVTRSMPVNANGDWRAGLNVSTLFGLSRYIDVSAKASGRYVRGVGYQGSDKYNSDNWTANASLSLMYKRNYFDFMLGGFVNWSDSRFSSQTLEGQTTWIKGLNSRMNWALPLGFTLLSDLNCAWYSGFRSDKKPSAIWNVELCKAVFKGKVVLSVKGYDLLNKTRNLKTSYADNYVEERQVNVLRRFVLFGLTYKFGKF